MNAPKPKLRWFQYSLRTLLVFVTLCAFACGWLATLRRQVERERRAAAAISKLGGEAAYMNPTNGWRERLLGPDFTDHVTWVAFHHPEEVTDDAMENLKALSQLQELYLHYETPGNTKVTDAGMVSLKGLRQLKVLWLDSAQVTDSGLENLKGLNQLQWLSLHGTQLSDSGLGHLTGLNQLEDLNLARTHVTDTGLDKLKVLTKLQRLCLSGTKVTDEGVKKLQQALPNCKIDIEARGELIGATPGN